MNNSGLKKILKINNQSGIEEILNKIRKKAKGNYFNSSDLHGLFFLLIAIGFAFTYVKSNLLGYNSKQTPVPTPYAQVAPTLAPTPTPSPSPIITSTPSIPWGQHIKVSDKETKGYYAPDDRMATADELLVAVNNFRQVYGLSTLQKSDTLCSIAQARANDLQALGKLDDHQGFTRFYYDPAVSQAFWHIGEVLDGGQPNLAVHIVEWGWAQSLTGHREELLKTIWTDGCGGVAGYFAVFVFGARR